ncbi:MAG: hypothetical protein ACOC91_00105 [bacterium]
MSGNTFKDLLRPYAEFLERLEAQLMLDVGRMTGPELRRLLRATEQPTKSNCSWSVYRVSAQVRATVRWELNRRKKAER